MVVHSTRVKRWSSPNWAVFLPAKKIPLGNGTRLRLPADRGRWIAPHIYIFSPSVFCSLSYATTITIPCEPPLAAPSAEVSSGCTCLS